MLLKLGKRQHTTAIHSVDASFLSLSLSLTRTHTHTRIHTHTHTRAKNPALVVVTAVVVLSVSCLSADLLTLIALSPSVCIAGC